MAAPWEKYAAGEPWTKYGGGASSEDGGHGIEHTWTESFDDWAKSIGSGAVQGIEGVLGFPGDVDQAIGWLMGQDPKKVPPSLLPTSADIGKATESIGLKPYQPKTQGGKYLRTIAEFVPGVLGGEGSTLKKALQAAPGASYDLLKSLVRWGVVPAVTSETAGELTEGGPLENIARIAGALVGAGGSAALNRTAGIAAKTVDELDTQATGLYKRMKNEGIVIDPKSFKKAATDATMAVYDAGSTPANHPKVWSALAEMHRAADRTAGRGLPMALDELQRMRRLTKSAAASLDPDERRVGMILRDAFNDYRDSLTSKDIIGAKDPQAAIDAWKHADKLWSQMKKGEIIEDLFRNADLNESTFAQAGWQKAIKDQFRRLAKDKKKMRTFAPDEREAIERVVKDDTVEWITRLIGKLAIRGQVSLIGTLMRFGPIGHIVGEMSKKISENITRGKAVAAGEVVRGGVPRQRLPVPLPAYTGFAGGVLAPSDKLTPSSPLVP